jgi:hypothetical protein
MIVIFPIDRLKNKVCRAVGNVIPTALDNSTIITSHNFYPISYLVWTFNTTTFVKFNIHADCLDVGSKSYVIPALINFSVTNGTAVCKTEDNRQPVPTLSPPTENTLLHRLTIAYLIIYPILLLCGSVGSWLIGYKRCIRLINWLIN